MHRPLIGITCGTSIRDLQAKTEQDRLNRAYSQALWQAGAMPVILPTLEEEKAAIELLYHLDGILISGGADISPELYGETPLNETVETDPPRDRAELPLIRAAVQQGTPLLAICRGIQSLNVALGGTLYQDLPTQRPSPIAHRQSQSRHVPTHTISIEPGSRLAQIVGGASMEVNSLHHQAVKEVGRGLRVVAFAPDGVIEALEDAEKPFLIGVQFHPEEMVGVCEKSRRLFRAFVEAASS
jgi:putative glutamine amidotransferase